VRRRLDDLMTDRMTSQGMDRAEIDRLVAEGRYAEAADALRRAGDLEAAQAMYEKIWDFRSAAEAARERGDRPALLRLLIDAKAWSEAAQVGDALRSAAPGEQARAAEVYERRRMWAEAAALREGLGALEVARELYQKAQQPLEVARLDEALGRPRDAGLGYEQFLSTDGSSSDAARAHLQLGRILADFQRLEDAVRHLQRAAADPALTATACGWLVRPLHRLGYRDAAEAALEASRTAGQASPEPAASLEVFLRSAEAGAGFAATRLAGRYAVLRLLGSGGMGRVYLARDTLRENEVAVKVVPPPIDARSRECYGRFVREAKLVAALKHPNIVSVIDFHEADGILAMELMLGGTLAERLTAPLPPAQARQIALQLTDALEAAHARGVIHRDVKPANIFFSGTGDAKLGDFGVAHLQDLGATQTAGFIGTLAYMSPEQISGAPLTFGADVYALGITLFQMLTGRLPFTGPDFVGQHLGTTPPSPSSLERELHPAWDALVAHALRKVPAERFASLEELRRALKAIPAEVRTSVSSAPPKESSAVTTPQPAALTPRYRRGGAFGQGDHSTLEHASDTQLGRQVVIEQFAPGYLFGPEGAARLTWLRQMARAARPGLQRVLAILPDEAASEGADAIGARVIYEAVTGPPAVAPLKGRRAARLRRVLEALRHDGAVHGALAASVVLEDHGPTLLVEGRGPTGRTAADDVRDLAALIE
jgi:serine/threonine-protein kinase